MSLAPTFDGSQVCANTDPEIFFPEDAKEAKIKVPQAKTLCNECSFQQPCLEYALENDVYGVWGATTEAERKEIRRNRRLSPPKSLSLITASWVNGKGPR